MGRRKRESRNQFDQKKEVRALARERVGRVKAGRVIVPQTQRKKPKHKERLDDSVIDVP